MTSGTFKYFKNKMKSQYYGYDCVNFNVLLNSLSKKEIL